MILTYLGKTVELKIPKTTLRLKEDIVNRLYDQAMIDQPVVPIYENEKLEVTPEIMIPLVMNASELTQMKNILNINIF